MPHKDPQKRKEYMRRYAREVLGRKPRAPKPRTPEEIQASKEKQRARVRAWELANREALREKRKVYLKNYRSSEKAKETRRAWLRELREQVLTKFGWSCACCGESKYEFLAIDHINGNGTKHIRSFKAPTSYLRWLLDHGTRGEFRILCHNCNQARAHHGACPHGNGI